VIPAISPSRGAYTPAALTKPHGREAAWSVSTPIAVVLHAYACHLVWVRTRAPRALAAKAKTMVRAMGFTARPGANGGTCQALRQLPGSILRAPAISSRATSSPVSFWSRHSAAWPGLLLGLDDHHAAAATVLDRNLVALRETMKSFLVSWPGADECPVSLDGAARARRRPRSSRTCPSLPGPVPGPLAGPGDRPRKHNDPSPDNDHVCREPVNLLSLRWGSAFLRQGLARTMRTSPAMSARRRPDEKNGSVGPRQQLFYYAAIRPVTAFLLGLWKC